tara:strand:- start:551 stop:751 length:201 start_codon:yes stop_codon:yes gene_type:complete
MKLSKEYRNFYKSGIRKFGVGYYQGAIDDYSKAIEFTSNEPHKKVILDLKEILWWCSRTNQKLSKN